MKKFSMQCRSGLLITCISALSAFTQIATAGQNDETDRCQNLQDCINKYREWVPKWENSIKDFSFHLKEELPKIEDEFKAFGEKGEKQLRQWLNDLEKSFPENSRGKPTPETTWI